MRSVGAIICLMIAMTEGFFLDSFNSHCQPILMFCRLNCANGYEKDGSGCDICHCKGSDTHLLLVDGTHHHIQNPCIPSQQSCPLNCEYYVKGGTGCEFCMCDNSHQTTTVPSTTVTPKATTVQKQATSSTAAPVTATSGKLNVTTHDPIDCELSKQVCDLRCKGEYLVDHKDCTYCVCRSDVC
ncbi:antistasin-like [Crassostrea angulata]|uniref:antistasin-like n=1 Tax=Magallana angulata TaxID=2784310 RepID=UPI0022B1C596|nr:antistasin-like [Crassostrea angulata]